MFSNKIVEKFIWNVLRLSQTNVEGLKKCSNCKKFKCHCIFKDKIKNVIVAVAQFKHSKFSKYRYKMIRSSFYIENKNRWKLTRYRYSNHTEPNSNPSWQFFKHSFTRTNTYKHAHGSSWITVTLFSLRIFFVLVCMLYPFWKCICTCVRSKKERTFKNCSFKMDIFTLNPLT